MRSAHAGVRVMIGRDPEQHHEEMLHFLSRMARDISIFWMILTQNFKPDWFESVHEIGLRLEDRFNLSTELRKSTPDRCTSWGWRQPRSNLLIEQFSCCLLSLLCPDGTLCPYTRSSCAEKARTWDRCRECPGERRCHLRRTWLN